jgi:hypothetical protein
MVGWLECRCEPAADQNEALKSTMSSLSQEIAVIVVHGLDPGPPDGGAKV